MTVVHRIRFVPLFYYYYYFDNNNFLSHIHLFFCCCCNFLIAKIVPKTFQGKTFKPKLQANVDNGVNKRRYSEQRMPLCVLKHELFCFVWVARLASYAC